MVKVPILKKDQKSSRNLGMILKMRAKIAIIHEMNFQIG